MAFRRVIDARGVDRRVYNLRARWRSIRMHRDFPRPLYEAVCATATGRDATDRSESPESEPTLNGVRFWSRPMAFCWLGMGVVGTVLLIQRIGTGSVEYHDVAIPAVTLTVGSVALFGSLWPWLRRPLGSPVQLLSPLEWVDDGQMAAAMVVNGRCPSCAYPVDPNTRETDGAVVCAECGGAWVVVRRGGALRLGR